MRSLRGRNLATAGFIALVAMCLVACRDSDDGRLLLAARRAIVSVEIASGKETLLLAPVGGNGVMLRDPALSPDGKRIAYVRSAAPAGSSNSPAASDLWIANVDGSDTHPSVQQAGVFVVHPSWTDDQHLVAIVSSPGGSGIETISAGTGEHGPLVPDTRDYALSRDRRKIAYTKTATDGTVALFVAAIDGSGARPLLANSPGFSSIAAPGFSPDGAVVAFAAVEPDGRTGVWVAPMDGAAPTRVGVLDEPVVALAFGRTGDHLLVLSTGTLSEMAVDDGTLRRIAAGPDVSSMEWSG